MLSANSMANFDFRPQTGEQTRANPHRIWAFTYEFFSHRTPLLRTRTRPVEVRFDPSVRESLESIAATLITTAGGAQVPLSALADVRKERGPNVVSRENVQRKTVVMANPRRYAGAGAADVGQAPNAGRWTPT